MKGLLVSLCFLIFSGSILAQDDNCTVLGIQDLAMLYGGAMQSLDSLSDLIPDGEQTGDIIFWNGDAWQVTEAGGIGSVLLRTETGVEWVDQKLGCTSENSCTYDATATVHLESLCQYADECGVCNGPGAIYDCGCSGIPEGDCDCDGNQLDALFVCGGTCLEDVDGDGVCDDDGFDDCIGQLDECGICNGPGAIYTCGCQDVPPGYCDCSGTEDVDLDGICDDVDDCIGNADSDGDGICDGADTCDGVEDECGVCNGPGAIYTCGCFNIPEGDCDCEGNQLDAVFDCGGDCLEDLDQDGVCDFTCGEDDVLHYGHAYGTVQIGDQCWLSENCRYLPEVWPTSQRNNYDARGYVPGYNGTDVSEAMETSQYQIYAPLYNRTAMEEWDLCPSGFKVPNASEFTELIEAVGDLATAGGLLKDAVYWNGTDAFGFGHRQNHLHVLPGLGWGVPILFFSQDTDVIFSGRYRNEIYGIRCVRE